MAQRGWSLYVLPALVLAAGALSRFQPAIADDRPAPPYRVLDFREQVTIRSKEQSSGTPLTLQSVPKEGDLIEALDQGSVDLMLGECRVLLADHSRLSLLGLNSSSNLALQVGAIYIITSINSGAVVKTPFGEVRVSPDSRVRMDTTSDAQSRISVLRGSALVLAGKNEVFRSARLGKNERTYVIADREPEVPTRFAFTPDGFDAYEELQAGPISLLENGGAEEADPEHPDRPRGWRADAERTDATAFGWDDMASHSGKHSLRLTLLTANDARWLTTVHVQPASWYRLSGWIKTSQVAGSHQTEDSGASLGVFETNDRAQPIFGTGDWTYVSGFFQTGGAQEITIAARLGFFSCPATGIAWFDDIKVERLGDLQVGIPSDARRLAQSWEQWRETLGNRRPFAASGGAYGGDGFRRGGDSSSTNSRNGGRTGNADRGNAGRSNESYRKSSPSRDTEFRQGGTESSSRGSSSTHRTSGRNDSGSSGTHSGKGTTGAGSGTSPGGTKKPDKGSNSDTPPPSK